VTNLTVEEHNDELLVSWEPPSSLGGFGPEQLEYFLRIGEDDVEEQIFPTLDFATT
jgi:hypothetical protein